MALDEDALAIAVDERVSLAGRALVPGFRDARIHPLWGGVQQLGAPIADAADVERGAAPRCTAYQTFDDGRGVIAVGAVADLYLLGADITRMPAAEPGQVPVDGTWATGEATFRSAAR